MANSGKHLNKQNKIARKKIVYIKSRIYAVWPVKMRAAQLAKNLKQFADMTDEINIIRLRLFTELDAYKVLSSNKSTAIIRAAKIQIYCSCFGL